MHRATLEEISGMRDAYRAEMDCQIVHDAIHHRLGWSVEFALAEGARTVGYASLAVGGPWRDLPTFYELYVVPERRSRAFALFDAFVALARPAAFEVQSNDVLSTTMALGIAADIATERIIFRDYLASSHELPGALLRCITPVDDIQAAIAARQGGGEWLLEIAGAVVGKGGILFHYNRPYGDIHMEVHEQFRGRGVGAYLVQELKGRCYELGGTPAARCDPMNVASQRTLQRAGFLPCAHILTGAFPKRTQSR